tara:strand:- start:1302 stop:2168 length:867 start_codon:yes stop_codon:yes gene_type:complete
MAEVEEIYEEQDDVEEELEIEDAAIDEVDEGEPEEEAETESEEPDEIVVSIDGEEPPPQEEQAAPEWVRELRREHRELKKRNRELESRVSQSAETNPAVTLGAKPSLENLDYDTEKYEQSLADWYERKRLVDDQQSQARRSEEEQQQAWNAKLEGYVEAKTKLKVKDYDDAEEVAQQLFNVVQQGVVIQGAENPALVIYALGKNPEKAKELAAIDDPVRFAFAVAKLESKLKVGNRKAATQPERTVSATARSSGSVDSTLERLREEASKTGNMDKVMAYKRAQKQAAK